MQFRMHQAISGGWEPSGKGGPVEELLVYRSVKVHQLLGDRRERHTRAEHCTINKYNLQPFRLLHDLKQPRPGAVATPIASTTYASKRPLASPAR